MYKENFIINLFKFQYIQMLHQLLLQQNMQIMGGYASSYNPNVSMSHTPNPNLPTYGQPPMTLQNQTPLVSTAVIF